MCTITAFGIRTDNVDREGMGESTDTTLSIGRDRPEQTDC